MVGFISLSRDVTRMTCLSRDVAGDRGGGDSWS